TRQIAMAHEYRTLAREGGIAERMIGMRMGVDHVADRFCGHGADRSTQPAPLAHAATGVDHGDRLIADDETDIGNATFIVGGHQFIHAKVDETRGGFFGNLERLVGHLRVSKRNQPAKGEDRARELLYEIADAAAQATWLAVGRARPAHATADGEVVD